MMKTKLTLFVAVLAAALFGMGCSSLDRGLVAYYPFNGNAKDESGNGNDGEVKGPILTTDRHGKKASAYQFDGTDDVIIVPHSQKQVVKTFTISSWFLFDKLPSERSSRTCVIFGKPISGPPFQSYSVEINGNVSGGPNDHFEGSHDPKSFVGATIAGPRNSKAFTLSQKGTWFHGVYAYDGKVATLYLDGTAVASVKMDGAPKPSNLPLTIGDYMEGRGYAFHGKIDDIRLYNRALTEEEVKELYDL